VSQISVGAAIGAGFQLIRRRPLAVLAWGAPPALLQIATIALLAPYYVAIYGPLLGQISGGGAPAAPAGASPQIFQMQAVAQLMNLVQLFVSAVLYGAVFRAVIHPERSAFAYLRVGLAELFLVVIAVAAFIALFVGLLVVMIPVGIVIGILAAATHSMAALGISIPLVVLALLFIAAIVAVRFALAGPMIVDDGQFHLFESWALTRGRLGSLLLIALALFGILIVLEVVVLAVLLALAAGAVGSLGGPAAAIALAQRSPALLASRVWPFLLGYAVLQIPVFGATLAIFGAPFARAYLDLKGNAADAFA
jgi:hypothetical protein